MKLLGALLLMLSGLAWGMERAGALRRRVELLMDLLCLLQRLSVEIAYSARPLGEMLAAGESRFCRKAMEWEGFAADPAGGLAWAGEQLLNHQKDRELLYGFAQGLGASDSQGQQEHLRLYQALAGDRLREAQEAYGQKKRLYLALGLFAGLTVSIVIL